MENWKTILGYEGIYEVSDKGRIKSLKRVVEHSGSKSGKITVPERIMKQIADKDGYMKICLSKDGKQKEHKVHRLVAVAFCENSDPTKKTCVNHINEIKTDNRAENLEWCDIKYNNLYLGRQKAIGEKLKIGVLGVNVDTGKVIEFDSLKSAEEHGFVRTALIACCKGKYYNKYSKKLIKDGRTYKGYKWFYATEYKTVEVVHGSNQRKRKENDSPEDSEE